jgi:hypothetical protein
MIDQVAGTAGARTAAATRVRSATEDGIDGIRSFMALLG